MQYPSISVIIPVYNSISTIQKCIDSVLEQTIKAYEIIVVNDGSTDGTESFLQTYKLNKNLDILIIINQVNGGPAKARNRGIKEAKGEWIAFLDADDRWLPHKTANQLEIYKRFPEISIIGTKLFPYVSNLEKNSCEKVTFTHMLFRNMFFTSTVIVKKNVLTQFSFDEAKRYSEDYKLWLQIISLYKGVVLREGLVVYSENQQKFKRKSLSNDLWKMESNELGIYKYFYKRRSISLLFLIVLITFSLLKFILRYLYSLL